MHWPVYFPIETLYQEAGRAPIYDPCSWFEWLWWLEETATLVLQSESDFSGAVKLREYVREQTLEFDSLFANVREAETQCKRGQLASVVAWEQRTHAAEWRSLSTAMRKHYANKRVRNFPCIWCSMQGTSPDGDD